MDNLERSEPARNRRVSGPRHAPGAPTGYQIWLRELSRPLQTTVQVSSENIYHYENTPMQYTAIFQGCKNDNF